MTAPEGRLLRPAFPDHEAEERARAKRRRSLAAKRGWAVKHWRAVRERVVEPGGTACYVPPCPQHVGPNPHECSRCGWDDTLHAWV